MDIYQTLVRPLLFSGLNADPEWLQQQSIQFLHWLDRTQNQPPGRWYGDRLRHSCSYSHPSLQQRLWGMDWHNPVGLAAGFDKDGLASGVWSLLGFGFAELGTVTLHAQPGNPKPRLFRLLEDRAALNRMGFNNQGAKALAERLRQRWGGEGHGEMERWSDKRGEGDRGDGGDREDRRGLHGFERRIPLGINLGKSKITSLEAAAEDYLGSFRLLKNLGDYFVVNVSSPNTPGLRSLQSSDQLDRILSLLQHENQARKPLLVKIAPDLEWEAIAAVLELAQTYQLAGIIATNTTISREGLRTQITPITGKPIVEEAGGISGAPLQQRSTEIIRFIYRETQGKLPIIGVGGIFNSNDAWEKITAGASLIQVYTGWIYEGPWMVRRILAGLAEKLDEQGLNSITDAVGTKN